MRRLRPYSLAIFFLVTLIATFISAQPQLGGPGLTWDEAYYYPTFRSAAAWTGTLLSDPGLALSSEGIVAGWEGINELPPVVKWLGALCVTAGPEEGWGALGWLRLFPALAFAGSLVLMLSIGSRLHSLLAGIIGASLYITLPRIFGHAHMAATETVFTFVALMTAWVAMHDLGRWKWRIALALCCGLALATKVNGIILIAAIMWWLLTRRIFDRTLFRPVSATYIRQDGITLVLILVLAPLVALAIWPWMWDQTMERLHAYYLFVRLHAHQGLWYFGERWNFTGELAPVSYPFVISHLTAPVLNLLLIWAGILSGLAVSARRLKIPSGHYLLALLMLAPLVASSLPSSPKYDGIRLFLPIFAPACLLAGIGLMWVVGTKLKKWRLSIYTPAIPAVLLLLMALLPGKRLDYYNLAAKGLGADEPIFPFEQTYWGNALTADVIADLNKALPPDARVKTLALQPLTFPILQDWGVLRPDIQFNTDPPYDAHLMQNRRGFWGPRTEWAIYTARAPLLEWGSGAQDESLVFLYDGRPPGAD